LLQTWRRVGVPLAHPAPAEAITKFLS
jgi:hypothetical protein